MNKSQRIFAWQPACYARCVSGLRPHPHWKQRARRKEMGPVPFVCVWCCITYCLACRMYRTVVTTRSCASLFTSPLASRSVWMCPTHHEPRLGLLVLCPEAKLWESITSRGVASVPDLDIYTPHCCVQQAMIQALLPISLFTCILSHTTISHPHRT